MKQLLLTLLLFTAFCTQAQTTHPSGVTGCIARYDFNSAPTTLLDVSGNNHHATTFNLSSSAGFRNRASNAVHFPGLNSGARAPHDAQFNVSQVSLVALVKFDEFYAGDCQGNAIVGKTGNYYTPGSWAMDVNDHGYDQNCSVYSPGKDQLSFVSPSVSVPSAPVGNFIQKNNWYLLVTSYDGSTVTAYQTLMDTATKLSSIAPIYSLNYNVALGSNTDSLYIGWMSHWSYHYWFNGDMDEVAIFNKALTTTDVKAIYDYLWGVGVGIADVNKAEQVSVSMANGVLQIYNAAGTPVHATVHDMAGRILTKAEVRGSLAQIDLGGTANGLLLVRLECDGGVATRKVIKL